jgi:hypothetical protein
MPLASVIGSVLGLAVSMLFLQLSFFVMRVLEYSDLQAEFEEIEHSINRAQSTLEMIKNSDRAQ